jgi:hypothetical protein
LVAVSGVVVMGTEVVVVDVQLEQEDRAELAVDAAVVADIGNLKGFGCRVL